MESNDLNMALEDTKKSIDEFHNYLERLKYMLDEFSKYEAGEEYDESAVLELAKMFPVDDREFTDE